MAGSLRAYVLALGPAILTFALPALAQQTAGSSAAPRTHAAAAVKSAPNTAQDWSEAAPANAGRETVAVMIDHAKVVRLPERTQTVIVGNPMIADITVQRNGIVVVTGKSYGVTNVIALDAGGALLAESFVRVQAATESVVIVQRGLERESYSCTPNCQPSILLGDANRYFGEVSGQAGQRNSLATQR
jgi:Pilus formation protein N terminal region